MKIGARVEIASVHLRERCRGGSTTARKIGAFEFVTWERDHDVSILIAVGGGGWYHAGVAAAISSRARCDGLGLGAARQQPAVPDPVARSVRRA